ncbi:MAG: hypothetical protein A3K19_29335 [Lentisphaerae bacterium RIFOXYB12_FULL_65_16]|nr:MAG: hypothetical protein A3K18_13310 [Lentisphaerae bacterium RIFOXYA12_64_32]OGV88402.1 MAG: hypothetical protein A3K19_29335 [Lentisphaerae bacterium RIFOXYB12_FULL_65_16]
MPRAVFLAILAVPLLLGGCVLPTPTDPYAGMSAGLPPAAAAIRTAVAEPTPGPLTLDKAIGLALAGNPELAATAHDLGAAVAQRDIAAGQRLPSLHAVGGYNNYLDGQRLLAARENGEPGVFSRDIFSGDLVVSLPLFTGGRLASEVKAAELLRLAAEHRLAHTRDELVFNVSSVFYGILVQRRLIESLDASRQALDEHLKRVDDLIAARRAAQVDRLRTEVRLADLAQRTVRETNVLAIQTRVLANLLGGGARESHLDVAGELAALETMQESSVDVEMSKAMAQRDDYLAARAVLEAQAKAVDAARAAAWPTVALQGAYGGRWAADPTDRPAGTDRADDVGRVGLVADLPLFEGGRIRARVREQQAKLAAARERLRKLELQVRLDVETAILSIVSSRQRIAATQKATEQAAESLRIEREKYELGRGAIVDVLDAQSALLEAQTTYYRALADLSVATAQLKLATGEQP